MRGAVLLTGAVAVALALASGTGAAGLFADGAPRGLRNNNPGNLRAGRDQWRGQVGVDDNGYLIFDNAQHGLRAMAVVLHNYQALHGIHTIQGLVARYAPAADGNPEGAYADFIAERLRLGVDEPFSIDAYMAKLLDAMITFENGSNPYSVVAVEQAAKQAVFG